MLAIGHSDYPIVSISLPTIGSAIGAGSTHGIPQLLQGLTAELVAEAYFSQHQLWWWDHLDKLPDGAISPG
jgi:hypothetical protein